MALGSGSAFGQQQVPVFYRVSTDKDPSHKTLTIQADSALVYTFRQDNTVLGVAQAPTGVFSPFIATWTFSIPFPATIDVEVKDAAGWETLGNSTIQLFGADVYKVRITYSENIPAAHGYIDAMVNGFRQTVPADQYMYQDFYNDDCWTRGSGN